MLKRDVFFSLLTVLFLSPFALSQSQYPAGPSPKGVRPAYAPEKAPGAVKLEAAIRKANPKFKGEIQMEDDGYDVLAIGVSGPNMTDITPLKGQKLRMVELANCTDLVDISPLKGLPIEKLYLEHTKITDLKPLEGMQLKELFLNGTPVSDLTPLKEMKSLRMLNLFETKVVDLTPLSRLNLGMLWLNNTNVSDLRPLADMPLQSLTLVGTKAKDLTPLRRTLIQRLHIGETEVTDLSPLEHLPLTRLIFTPKEITKGLDVVRKIKTLKELDTVFPPPEGRKIMVPKEFWEKYDRGVFE